MSPPNETTKDLAAKVNRLKTLLALDELDTSRDAVRFDLCQAEIIAFYLLFHNETSEVASSWKQFA